VTTVSKDIQLGYHSCREEAEKDATLFSGSSIITSHEKVLAEKKVLSNILCKLIHPS